MQVTRQDVPLPLQVAPQRCKNEKGGKKLKYLSGLTVETTHEAIGNLFKKKKITKKTGEKLYDLWMGQDVFVPFRKRQFGAENAMNGLVTTSGKQVLFFAQNDSNNEKPLSLGSNNKLRMVASGYGDLDHLTSVFWL